jgi:epoxide hydrolase 4
MNDIRHERIPVGALELHVAVAGSGPPVVLLHGFPENWTSWRRQFAPLADAGFSVWAPDQRGYDGSDRPAPVEAYHLRHLVADLAGLIQGTGYPRAHIVGHDWGGIVAWALAHHRPDLVDRLVIVNAPHPRIFREKVRLPPQMLRSSYVALFLLPRVPEWLLSARNYRLLRAMFRGTAVRAGAFSEEDIQRYVDALSPPGALTAALNYYRANARDAASIGSTSTVAAETLVIWGDRDPALGGELLDTLDVLAPRLQVHHLPDIGHWVQNEAPEAVNRVLVDFLTRGTLENTGV